MSVSAGVSHIEATHAKFQWLTKHFHELIHLLMWVAILYSGTDQLVILIGDTAASPTRYSFYILLFCTLLISIAAFVGESLSHRVFSCLISTLCVLSISYNFSELLVGIFLSVLVNALMMIPWQLSRRTLMQWLLLGVATVVAALIVLFMRLFLFEAAEALSFFEVIQLYLFVQTVVLCMALRSICFAVPLGILGLVSVLTTSLRHDIQLIEPNLPEKVEARIRSFNASLSFYFWLLSRPDLEQYRSAKRPYPVFVAAAEGGGAYAAAHTYIFLKKMEANCSGLNTHLFALFGVSGGSLGTSLYFGSLPANTATAVMKLCKPSTEIDLSPIARDHLKPVTAALLFVDLVNQLTFREGSFFDRSTALRQSIEKTPNIDPEVLRQGGWSSYWRPNDSVAVLGGRPALFNLATNIVSGNRYLFGPFPLKSTAEQFARDFNFDPIAEIEFALKDVPVSEAVVASASFPWFTPSRRLEAERHGSFVLADGGYFDNSGAETALDLMQELASPELAVYQGAEIRDFAFDERLIPSKESEFAGCNEGVRLVYISSGNYNETSWNKCELPYSLNFISIRSENVVVRSGEGHSFAFDPLITLLSTRSKRGELALLRMVEFLCGSYGCVNSEHISIYGYFESVIDVRALGLPLGWYIPSVKLLALAERIAPEKDDGIDDPIPGRNQGEIIDNSESPLNTMSYNSVNTRVLRGVLGATR